MRGSPQEDQNTEAEYCAELKLRTKALYDSTESVLCPFFNEQIKFTSDGFHHLQYNTAGSERSKKNQIRRYKSFILAPYILKRAGTLQEHRKFFGPVGRAKGDGFRETKVMEDWCFVDLIKVEQGKDVCIKVVVRRIGDGPLHFCSVMPVKTTTYLSSGDADN